VTHTQQAQIFRAGGCHHLAEGVILGEEAADGLAVDLARGEVDQTLAVLRAVLDLQGTNT
jgi:hypothetical protein